MSNRENLARGTHFAKQILLTILSLVICFFVFKLMEANDKFQIEMKGTRKKKSSEFGVFVAKHRRQRAASFKNKSSSNNNKSSKRNFT
jgi:hypothetical protein